jgi:hypothetical protein
MTHPLASATTEAQYPKVPASTSKSSQSFAQPGTTGGNVHSLAALWARKYYVSVTANEQSQVKNAENLKEITSPEGRERTAQKLMQNLTWASAQAWSLTETMLSKRFAVTESIPT